MELARTFLFEGQRGECGQKAFCRQIAQMDQRYTHEIETAYERLDCPVTVLGGQGKRPDSDRPGPSAR